MREKKSPNSYKNRKKKVNRGNKKGKETELCMMSANAAQLKGKLNSFKGELKSSNAAIFTVQETHYATKGKIQIPNFEIFEAIRKKHSGGTLIGAHKALKPMLIAEYSEDFELLVIEITIRNKEIRVITGYGPQETWSDIERMPFFAALEEEIAKAEMLGKSMIIEMDSNSKLGKEIIPNDPHNQTPNGRILAGIIDRHGLIVVNGLTEKCKGMITRRRVTKDAIEESIIDHVLITDDLKDDLISLIIDEDKTHVLNRVSKSKKKGVVTVNSDHNALISDFEIKWNTKYKRERIEMFNLKNAECQKKFKELTSEEDILSSIFTSNENINISASKFIKKLDDCIKKCFNKIRITDKPNKEIDELFEKRKRLRTKTDEKSKLELEEVEDLLANKCTEANYEKIKDEIATIKCDD